MKKFSFLLILVLISLQTHAQYGHASLGMNYERNSFEKDFLDNLNLEGKLGIGFGDHIEVNMGLLWIVGSSFFDIYSMNKVLIEEEDGSSSQISVFSLTSGYGLNYSTKFLFKSHDNHMPEGPYLGSSIGYIQTRSDLYVDEVLNDNGQGLMPNVFYENKYKDLEKQKTNSLKLGFYAGITDLGFDFYVGMNRNFIMNKEEVLFPNQKWSLMFGFSSGLIF